jgi:hypothetical protein
MVPSHGAAVFQCCELIRSSTRGIFNMAALPHRAGMPIMLLLLAALTHHCFAAPDLSGDVVMSEYLLMKRPPAAALFDCDSWDDSLHVTLQLMSASPLNPGTLNPLSRHFYRDSRPPLPPYPPPLLSCTGMPQCPMEALADIAATSRSTAQW